MGRPRFGGDGITMPRGHDMKAALHRAFERLRRSPSRWALAASAVYLLVSLWIYVNCPASWAPGSDGHYSWMYARSLAYDRDLDFTNDYDLCGDPMAIGWTTPAHRPANIFYLGPAAFWTPAVWLLKHFVRGTPNVAGGCVGPVPAIVLTMSSFAGAVVVLVCGLLAQRLVSPKLAALAALLATLGGHLIYFTGINPSYSHSYDAMCVALYLYVLLRIREGDPRRRLVLAAGLLLGLAVLQRASNLVFFVVSIAALCRTASRAEIRRSAPAVAAIGVTSVASGLVPILLANRAIFGRLTPFTHGPHFLHLAHAHPWLLVFDLRGGVFAWAPTLWLAVPGFVLLARRRELRWLVVPFALCGVFELYLSSAALDWQGARRLLNLTPLGALGIALTLERVARWLESRPRRLAHASAFALALFVAWGNGAVCMGFALGKLPWDTPLTQAQRFGEGEKQTVAATEATLGALPVLPAAWLFALRYRRLPVAFGWAAHPAWYQRDHHSLDYHRADFPFTAPETRLLLRGFHVEDRKPSCIAARAASAVFAAQWPFATRARLTYDASQAQELSLGSRSILGFATPWSKVSIRPGKRLSAFVTVPAGGFDSGINELELRTTGGPESLCLWAIEFVDDTRYPASPEADASPSEHLWHGGRYLDEGGDAPSIAVGSGEGGAWAVEAHQSGRGQMAYFVASPGELQSPKPFDSGGFHPSVAAGDDDAVIEVHQTLPAAGPLACRMGRVRAQAGVPDVAWERPVACGTGYAPSIAIGGAQWVLVRTSDASAGALGFRTGSYAGSTLLVGDARPLEGRGFFPAVAIGPAKADGSGRFVVEAHQEDVKAGPLWMRVGTLSRDGDVAWGGAREYDDEGRAPSIAIFGSTLVEVHQGQDDAGALWIKTGRIGPSGEVTWTATRQYDTGARPAFAVEQGSGRAMEVHQGALAAGALWGHDADVYRTGGGSLLP